MKSILPLLALIGALAAPAPAAEDPRFVALSLDEQGWKRLDSYGPDNPWDGVPRELQKFGGVPFFLSAKMQFHGTGDARDNRFYPTHLKGLEVAQRAARLHVLHGCNMSDTNGRPVAALRLNYAGGGSHTLLMNYGVHTRDWWKHKDEKDSSLSDTNSAVVWTGTSDDAEKIGATHRLFKTTFDLPPGEKPVETIDAFSLFSRSAFVLLGLTIETPGAETPATKVAPSADLAQFRDELVMEVSGPGGQPVGGARVKGLAQGENRSRLGVPLGRMDDTRQDVGVVTVDFPADTRTLLLSVSAGTYGPKALELKAGADGRLPRKAAIELPVGQRIRGTVLTPDGRPLAKAKVEILGRAAANFTSGEIEFDEVTTDSQGVWKSQLAANSAPKLAFRVTHSDYSLTRFNISETPAKDSVAFGELLTGEAKFQLAPRIRITGVVRDSAAKPVARASVTLAYENGSSGTGTDDQGRFNLSLTRTGEVTLIVQRSNLAPFVAEMTLTGQSEQVNIKLQPGEPFRGRVVEGAAPVAAASAPLAGATVMVYPPKGTYTLWTGTTGADGRFQWDQAPPGPLRVTVRHGNFIARTFSDISGTNEFEFALWRNFAAWGTAVDAESKQPVPEFTVTSGYKSGNERMYWNSSQSAKGRDGGFVFQSASAGGYSAQSFLKIEAPGYQPEMFPAGDLGWRSNRLELRCAGPAKGVVKLPDGQPAVGAEILVVGEGHVTLNLARFDRNESATANPNRVIGGWTSYSAISSSLSVTSATDGRFELPLRLAQRIVVAHQQGYAETTFSNLAVKAEVALKPWGQIEGVVRVGRQPVAGLQVRMSDSRGADELSFGPGSLTRADDEGRFRFARVPPGVRWVSRQAQTNTPAYTWSRETPVTVEPGKTASAAIGGTGRPIIGRVVPEDASRKIAWASTSHNLYSVQPQSSDRTPEAVAAREVVRSYPVVFASDGSFRAEDVPPGSYRISLSFYEPKDAADPNSAPDYKLPAGFVTQEFEVGPLPGGRSDEPLDLGALELKNRRDAASVR